MTVTSKMKRKSKTVSHAAHTSSSLSSWARSESKATWSGTATDETITSAMISGSQMLRNHPCGCSTGSEFHSVAGARKRRRQKRCAGDSGCVILFCSSARAVTELRRIELRFDAMSSPAIGVSFSLWLPTILDAFLCCRM